MLSNYPPGLSDSTPGCPWSEPEIPEKEFDVTCCQTLSKTTSVLTSNYIPGASGVDYEYDPEGSVAVGWHDPDDTSDTNWADEYHDNEHYTPLQLIGLFKKHLENELIRMGEVKNERWIKHLIEECSDWTEDDTEYVED
jgi:hypothetical protein